MNILGINYYFHDSSACLLQDGRLVSAIEEERLNRDKHTYAFPELAIERCVAMAGLEFGDIDHIAVSIQPLLHWGAKLAYATKNPRHGTGFLRFEASRLHWRLRAFARWFLRGWPRLKHRPRVHFVEHHLSHVAGSFLVSPYETAALLGLDGAGEWATSWLGAGSGTDTRCFGQSTFPHSLGSFYEAATEFCGFRPNYDEGKTMGLAAYGDPARFATEVGRMVRVDAEGGIHVDLSKFSYQHHGDQRCGPGYHAAFGAPRKPGEPFAQHHRDLAAACQQVLEERVLQVCRILHHKTGARHVVLSGGVALNSVMNGRIVRESPFDDLYVTPGPGDNGTCIGAAFYVRHAVLGHPRDFVLRDPYLGPAYDDAELRLAIEARGLTATRLEDAPETAADLIHEGRIVGWYQGRMEFGPRSLGNRSILANPTLPTMKDHLNARVKHREAFRPFAPSALAESADEIFDTEVEAPFMLKVCDVRPAWRERLPAITHADGTARLQTVNAELNPRYHRLIAALGRRNGAAVVLNTSYNVMGQPIVESPLEAIDCYLGTGIDALVLGDYLLTKPAEPAA
ncbi:MAG: carbamoyltransferase C-terminal domain-containing protein [Myxococcota bacterium]